MMRIFKIGEYCCLLKRADLRFRLSPLNQACGEFAVSCGELEQLSASVNRYVPDVYDTSAERWRVVAVFVSENVVILSYYEKNYMS